eukprot:Rmarinus@m.678
MEAAPTTPDVTEPKTCATVLSAVVGSLINTEAPEMSLEQRIYFGMNLDPINMPLLVFFEALLTVCTTFEAIAALIYLRKGLKAPPSMLDMPSSPCKQLTKYNVHRIVFVSFVLSNIMWCDKPFTVKSWAKWSNTWTQAEIQQMKVIFLKELDWRLHITQDEFDVTIAELEQLAVINAAAGRLPLRESITMQ